MKTSFKASFLAAPCAVGLFSLLTACTYAPSRRSSPEYNNDTLISAAVTDRLVGGLGIKREGIQVETYRSAVTISGFVGSEEQRANAAQFALSAPGVQSVTNELTVLGSTAPAAQPLRLQAAFAPARNR